MTIRTFPLAQTQEEYRRTPPASSPVPVYRPSGRPSRHTTVTVQGPPEHVLRTPLPDSRTEWLEWLLCHIDPWVGYLIVGLAGFLLGRWMFGGGGR